MGLSAKPGNPDGRIQDPAGLATVREERLAWTATDGAVGGVCVDSHDHVFTTNRGGPMSVYESFSGVLSPHPAPPSPLDPLRYRVNIS